MSELLYRLGMLSARRAWLFIIGWIAILGLTGTLAATAGGTFSTSMSIGGTAAQNTVTWAQTSTESSSASAYGKLVLLPDGSYTFRIDNSLAAVQELRAGEQRTEVYNYTLTDKDGSASTSSLTLTVTGVNDVPVAQPDAYAVDEGALASTPATLISGNVKVNDRLGDGSASQNTVAWGSEAARHRAIGDGLTVAESKEHFFASADVLSLHLRLNEQTKGVVTLQDLSQMKPTALLVNTSRAELIEPDALITSLNRGRPGMAAVDVFESEPILQGHPLLRLENCICTPHIGYVEQDSYELYFGAAFDNIVNFARGTPTNIINPGALQNRR